MKRDLIKSFSLRSKSARIVTLTVTSTVLLFGLILLQGGSTLAFAGDNSLQKAEAEIAKIPVRYAVATDAIGRGDFEEGRDIYREIFTEDAVIEISFLGDPIFGPPVDGPDGWANFVNSLIGGVYVATQHFMGSILVEVHGSSATMSTYVIGTHVTDNGFSSWIATGNYYDDVVRRNGQWKILHRRIVIISMVPPPF